MAKVFRIYDHKTKEIQWVPATSTCQSKDDAAKKVGCEPGVTCTVTTRFSGDLTAQEYIAQQKAGETTTPAPTTTTTTKTTGKTTTPTTTTPTTTTPTPTPESAPREKIAPTYQTRGDIVGEYRFDLGYCTAPVPPPNPIDQWMKIPLSPGVYYAGAGAGYGTDDGSLYGREWTNLYVQYMIFLRTAPDNWPVPKSINEFIARYDEVYEANKAYYKAGFTQEQIDSYIDFQEYASSYGSIEDWIPSSLGDYLSNYDKAQQQLDLWKQKAGPEAAGFTDEQIRAFKDYQQWYYDYGKPGEWMPVDVGDFITNQERAQEQLAVWQQQAAEVEEYEISPEEAAKRQEEYYQAWKYGQKEAYKEYPSYEEPFAAWLPEAAKQVSGALKEYIEGELPSLKAGYEATLPTLTGYATREEARAEKARREAGFTPWLEERMPQTYQEYMSQRPSARGERIGEYSPTLRFANW